MTDEDTPEEIAEERITNLMRELDECKAKLVEMSAPTGDWTDEAKARLEEEEKRLRLKAANLQERHGAWSLMAKQELVVADDIRAALEMIERRGERLAQWEREEVTRAANCCGQEERAEAAEAKLAEAEAEHPTGVCLERGLRAERDKLRRDLDRKDHEVSDLKAESAGRDAHLSVIAKELGVEGRVAAVHAVRGLKAEVSRLTEMVGRLKKDRDVFRAALRGGGE